MKTTRRVLTVLAQAGVFAVLLATFPVWVVAFALYVRAMAQAHITLE